MYRFGLLCLICFIQFLPYGGQAAATAKGLSLKDNDEGRGGTLSYDFDLDDLEALWEPELQLRILLEKRRQEDLAVVRMQLLQLNLMKILILMDVIILICVFYCVREN